MFHVKHMNVQALFFDMDGLMFNTEDLSFLSFHGAASAFGKRYTKDLHLEILGTRRSYFLGHIIRRLELPLSEDQLFVEFKARVDFHKKGIVSKMSGLDQLLAYASQHSFKNVLVTSTPKERAYEMLFEYNLYSHFDSVVTGDCVQAGKPAPDPYLLAAKFAGVHPRDSVVLEDAPSGVESGKRAGCHVIAIPNGFSMDCSFDLADRVLSSLEDVPAYLEGMRSKV